MSNDELAEPPNGEPDVIPQLWVGSVTFSDGQTLTFAKSDIVVIVGPNNSGKSVALRSIGEKLSNGGQHGPVVKDVHFETIGTAEDVLAWLRPFTKTVPPESADPQICGLGAAPYRSHLASWGSINANRGFSFSRFFCHRLGAEERLQASVPASSIAFASEPPAHPVHYLARDDRLEERVSKQFRRAFGADLLVNRFGGNQIPLHVGDRPQPAQGEDRASFAYMEQLAKLPLLHLQGDGMRSFAGVLIHTAVGTESLLLIDEPEAFLHPPQARQLGQMLVSDGTRERQLFIATHSVDVLRGILNTGSKTVRVIRMCRDGNVNRVSQLDNENIAELWGDPLLRESNILDGLFHERVIVCESDADARFYSAVANAIVGAKGDGEKQPDVMFTHCGGKDRVAMVARALRGVDVPVFIALDFDVLSEETPLRQIIEAAGGQWSEAQRDWALVKSAIDSKKPELECSEVKEEIVAVLDGIAVQAKQSLRLFPREAKDSIQRILRRASPWASAKTVGKSYVPSGESTQAYERLQTRLRTLGIHVVEVGEIEGFVRSVGNHGPRWTNEVLKTKNLASDPDLGEARTFVASLLGLSD
jgi:AAA domain, putative AbiEii toxin, Type IV TA system